MQPLLTSSQAGVSNLGSVKRVTVATVAKEGQKPVFKATCRALESASPLTRLGSYICFALSSDHNKMQNGDTRPMVQSAIVEAVPEV